MRLHLKRKVYGECRVFQTQAPDVIYKNKYISLAAGL